MTYNYPYLEKFYQDNFSELLSWNSSLRPSKSCPKNGAAGIIKFQEFYKKSGVHSFTEKEVLKILNAENVEDGDTIFHQNLRVMRELNFLLPIGDKKYKFTDDFLSFVESGHTVDCYIIEKLMSIASIDDLTMYFNFLICVMREAANYGQVIQYGDSALKFEAAVPDDEKRKEHQQRVYNIYGFKGDEARTVPENYTPNISYFCHAVLKQLGILAKSDKKVDNMRTLVLTPLGELILKKIDENIQYGKEKFENQINKIKTSINEPLQQIFYGAPGTGKSFKIMTEVEDAGRIYYRTTFHPDSDYSTFVGCYKPTMDKRIGISENDGVTRDGDYGRPKTKGNIIYSFTPQAFTNAYVKAWQTDEPVFLIIEEINRGNCAQIFGDLFQLLDRDENGFSQYKVDADADLADYIRTELGKKHREIIPEFIYSDEELKLQLPSNLYIWATMNTSDQSLFPIDSAFKRRWEWVYSPIAEGKEKDGSKAEWQIEGQGVNSWWKFIQGINEVIDVTTHSEDKKLGFYFCKPTKKVNGSDKYPKIITNNTFVNKVVFYLWNDVFKVYGFKSEIFDMKNEKETLKITFKSFYKEDGAINENTVRVFVNNVMGKAPKDKVQSESQNEQSEEREGQG